MGCTRTLVSFEFSTMAMAMRGSTRVNNAASKRAGGQVLLVRCASMQAVKLRMKQVKNIAKITKAMQMVASSKLRGAQTRLEAARPMADAMADLFGSLEKSEENPDGVEFAPKTDCIIPMTSDSGLCGGVNGQIVKLVRLEIIPGVFGSTKPNFSLAACIADEALEVGA